MRAVKLLIVLGMLASALHFADNTVAIERYPEPGWITPFGVVAAWCAVTAIAVFALTRKAAGPAFFAAASAYSLVLLSGLLHYAFDAPARMAMRSNATVLAEALTGVALAVALLQNARQTSGRKRDR